MCGIVCLFHNENQFSHTLILDAAKSIRHRGPDWNGLYQDQNVIMAHERLAIVDIDGGSQPLESSESVLAVNGEIYNHKQLEATLKQSHNFQTKSDCEVIQYLYKERGVDFLNDLNGIFGFVLYDKTDGSYIIARDHVGIVPLYYGYCPDGQMIVASELKAIQGIAIKIENFPPGHYYSSKTQQFVEYYKPSWAEEIPTNKFDSETFANNFEQAVKRQLMCDVPYGLLISGGLDSSLVAALAKKNSENRVESEGQDKAWWPQVHSFSVGLEGSPDLKMAQKVADHIGTIHHPIVFTVEQGLNAIKDVIYHLETFDVTTIRSATPMYLMARKIKSMGIKMVLSGEGADEMFGGYLYFHKAPNEKEFHEECVRKIKELHMYDCLRANKAMAAWGVEARVPFLDKKFLDYAMNIKPSAKMVDKTGIFGGDPIEKEIIRLSFDEDLIPEEILWRQKEQFSDGVGYSWIDSLQDHCEKIVSDLEFSKRKQRFPDKTPQTKEAYWFRSLYEQQFSDYTINTVPFQDSVACSTAKALEWDESLKNNIDPSGRAVNGIHKESK